MYTHTHTHTGYSCSIDLPNQQLVFILMWNCWWKGMDLPMIWAALHHDKYHTTWYTTTNLVTRKDS